MVGRWEVFNKVERPKPIHVHDKPDLGALPFGAAPEVDSVWRCSCGKTWKVYKGITRSSDILLSWDYMGAKYCLTPFNYDQPSPFPQGGGC